MESEIGVLQVEKRIRNRVKRQMEKTQREYYLNEQLKAIQKELGEGEDGKDETRRARSSASRRPSSPRKRARRRMAELKKLRTMSPMSAEATVVRNYLDWMLSHPLEEAQQGQATTCVAAEKVLERRPLRAGEGQGAHHRIPRRAARSAEGARARSCAWSARPASARPRSASRSRGPRAATSCACRWAACATRRRSAATGAPISARCPARSSRA